MSASTILFVASLWGLSAVLYLIAFNTNRFGRYVREAVWLMATYTAVAGVLRLLFEMSVFTEIERRQILTLLAFSFALALSGLSISGWCNGKGHYGKGH